MSEMDEEQELSPETPEADAAEQRVALDDRGYTDLPPQVLFDANEADAVEQRTPVRDDAGTDLPRQVPFDADEADAAEQSRRVETDDDDYR